MRSEVPKVRSEVAERRPGSCASSPAGQNGSCAKIARLCQRGQGVIYDCVAPARPKRATLADFCRARGR